MEQKSLSPPCPSSSEIVLALREIERITGVERAGSFVSAVMAEQGPSALSLPLQRMLTPALCEALAARGRSFTVAYADLGLPGRTCALVLRPMAHAVSFSHADVVQMTSSGWDSSFHLFLS